MWTVKTTLSENGDVIKVDTTRRQTTSTVSIQNGGQALPCSFNFVPISQADICRYIEMHMRQVHLTMCTEGITAFSNRYGIVVWTVENDMKTISMDANLF